jgi:hypothetical protein
MTAGVLGWYGVHSSARAGDAMRWIRARPPPPKSSSSPAHQDTATNTHRSRPGHQQVASSVPAGGRILTRTIMCARSIEHSRRPRPIDAYEFATGRRRSLYTHGPAHESYCPGCRPAWRAVETKLQPLDRTTACCVVNVVRACVRAPAGHKDEDGHGIRVLTPARGLPRRGATARGHAPATRKRRPAPGTGRGTPHGILRFFSLARLASGRFGLSRARAGAHPIDRSFSAAARAPPPHPATTAPPSDAVPGPGGHVTARDGYDRGGRFAWSWLPRPVRQRSLSRAAD